MITNYDYHNSASLVLLGLEDGPTSLLLGDQSQRFKKSMHVMSCVTFSTQVVFLYTYTVVCGHNYFLLYTFKYVLLWKLCEYAIIPICVTVAYA